MRLFPVQHSNESNPVMGNPITETCEGCGTEYIGKTTETPDQVMLCPDCAKGNEAKVVPNPSHPAQSDPIVEEMLGKASDSFSRGMAELTSSFYELSGAIRLLNERKENEKTGPSRTP